MRSSTPQQECMEVVPFESRYIRPVSNSYRPLSNDRYKNEFEQIKCLGSGGFGSVFEASSNIDGNRYAVKKITLPKQVEEWDPVFREVKTLAKLNHDNIVRYHCSWVEESQLKCQNNTSRSGSSAQSSAGYMTTDRSSDHPNNGDEHRSRNSQENDDFSIVFKCSNTKEASDDSMEECVEEKSGCKIFLYIQMELCESENLFHWLQKNETWESREIMVVRSLFSQIVSAVEYVHGNKLIHRDLKPRNILFSLDGRVKIGDFGLVTTMENSVSHDSVSAHCHIQRRTEGVGTELYSAPEQRQSGNGNYDYKVDIYAMGLILFELCYPIGSQHECYKTFAEARKGIYPKKFQEIHSKEMEVIKLMLSKDPLERPTAAELWKLPPLYENLNEREGRDSHLQITLSNKKSTHDAGTQIALQTRKIVQKLREQKDICDNMCTVMTTCSDKLLQYIIDKKSIHCIDKLYLSDLKKFATTLHFYSPETYKTIRKEFNLCLPHPREIWMWYQQPRGWPGIMQSSVEVMVPTTKSMEELLGCLHVYEVKVREDVECIPAMDQTGRPYARYHGYADVGNQLHGNHIDTANQALIMIAVTITADKKFPVGLFYGKNFTPSQKATLIKLCIDKLSASKFRVIAITLSANISSLNLASALGANIDTAPFQPYFMHNDTKYYLIINPKHVLKLMRELFSEKRRLYHNGELIEYSFVEKLHNNKNELQITDRTVSSLWNQSVAQGIERMQREIIRHQSLPNLGDSSATVTFITNINKVLGIYGSRYNISRKNYTNFQNQIQLVCGYIQRLKDCNGNLVIESTDKFVFNTMLCNLYGLQCLYTDYVESRILKCLQTRKFVLVNSNLFFSRAYFTANGLSSIYEDFIEKVQDKRVKLVRPAIPTRDPIQ